MFDPVHESFMCLAIEEARKGASEGEVPVGAALVLGGELLAQNHNRREQRADPTAHAEMLVLQEAARKIGHWRLLDADLYVTLEPCAMCAGAMVHARIGRCFYGARDPKTGAAGSLCNILQDERLNHQVEVFPGILAEDCGAVLRGFFQDKR